MSNYDKLKKQTSTKYLNRYVPKDLTKNEKEKVSKIILDRREGKSNQITPQLNRRPRRSTFTIQFTKKYGGIKDKSLKNLSKYFKIQPVVLNTIYDKAGGAWNTSGSRLGVSRQAWSYARVYKGILNIIKARQGGELPKSEGHDKTLVEKAVNYNKYIPPEIPSK